MFLPLAFIIDWLFGEPDVVYKRVPHPIVLIGNWVARVEKWLNGRQQSIGLGILGWFMVVIPFAVTAWIAEWLLAKAGGVGFLIMTLLASAFLAYNSLGMFVGRVQQGLSKSLDDGREAVSHIVGRDTGQLDKSAVVRASIESLAENFSDGVVAPLFWLTVAGLPGLVVYKAINTMDSMWGYRNDRFERFGKFAARMDDIANWVPARLSGLIIVIASQLSRQACGMEALKAMVRDAKLHNSPNAGWPEAAMAGGLGILLAGPREYEGKRVEATYIGRQPGGRADLNAKDIGDALRLYRLCGFVTLALCLLGAWIIGAVRGNFLI